jgi:chromosome partitioning protein
MIITVTSFKGGVGKSTTAIHMAAYLQQKAPTLLVDGDLNRSVLSWAQRGEQNDAPPSFKVVDEEQGVKYARKFEHIVIDTAARPSEESLKTLADGCDFMIIPTTPDAFGIDALMKTVQALAELDADRYKVLLTITPPYPSKEGERAKNGLIAAGLPVYKSMIRRFSAFQKAALLGVPVYDVSDPKAAVAWKDYQSIGKEILS